MSVDPDQLRQQVRDKLGLTDEAEAGEKYDGSVSIDDLSGEDVEEAISYLSAVGRESTVENIEETAYFLRSVDQTETLHSGLESKEERSYVDHSVVAPTNMEPAGTWHTREGDYYQILTATSLPRLVTPGWLVPITLSEYDVRLSVHIQPRETSSVKGKLQQRLTQMKSAIQWKKKRGRTDVYEEEHEQSELERLLRKIIQGKTQLYNVAVYFEVHSESKEGMEEATRKIKRTVKEQGMELTPVEDRQIEAQQAIAPVATDPIRNQNTVQLEALATFFNFVEPPISNPEGVLMGFDDSKRPVIVDRFALSGHSKAVSGKVGSGKTYSVKLALYRRLLNNPDMQVILFDPLGDDFTDFAEKLGGSVIEFGGDDRINPFEIHPPEGNREADDLYTEKVRSVIEILKTNFSQSEKSGMTAEEEGVCNPCIHYAYSKHGITDDPETFYNQSPILDDFSEAVGIIAEGGLESEDCSYSLSDEGMQSTLNTCPNHVEDLMRNPPERYVNYAKDLEPKLESFGDLSVNKNLNGRTNIDLDNRIICFDMNQFADTGEMPLIMHVMLDWAYQETRRTETYTDVTFEEVHYLLKRKGARNLINLFIRHARHFNSGLTLITQTPDEFLKHDEKREIYDNCDIKQLFYQENVSPEVINYFDLSDEEVRHLRRAARGQSSNFSECLLSTSEHGRRRLEVYSDPYEQHVVEEDLDPHGYIKQKGLDKSTNGNQGGRLETAAETAAQNQAADQNGSENAIQTEPGANSDAEVDSPNDLKAGESVVQKDGVEKPTDEKEDEGPTSPRDPYRVQSGDQESSETHPPHNGESVEERESEGDSGSPPPGYDTPDSSVDDSEASESRPIWAEEEDESAIDEPDEITLEDIQEAQESATSNDQNQQPASDTDNDPPIDTVKSARDGQVDGSMNAEKGGVEKQTRLSVLLSSIPVVGSGSSGSAESTAESTAPNKGQDQGQSRLGAIVSTLPIGGDDSTEPTTADDVSSEENTTPQQQVEQTQTETVEPEAHATDRSDPEVTPDQIDTKDGDDTGITSRLKSFLPIGDSETVDESNPTATRDQSKPQQATREPSQGGKVKDEGMSDTAKWLIKIIPLVVLALGLFVLALL